jgi:hypothetical protein
MPTKVGIHGFAARAIASRGWRAFARHDDRRRPESRDFQLLVPVIRDGSLPTEPSRRDFLRLVAMSAVASERSEAAAEVNKV